MPPPKEEFKAIKELREDQTRIVLTVDKGVAMVIMDKQQYMDKATALLQDTNTYRIIPKDPTNKLKNKIIGIRRDIKQTGGLKDTTYCKVYPTSAVPPKFYGLPKIHNVGTPLRPIVSSRDQSPMGWLRSWQVSYDHWWDNLNIISKTPNTS